MKTATAQAPVVTSSFGPPIHSSQPVNSLETRAVVDPKRCFRATGENADSIWVAIVGDSEDVMDGGAKRLATRYAFDGRPDVGVERSFGPIPDDGSVMPPVDLASSPTSGITNLETYRRIAAEVNMRQGRKRHVAYHLIRPTATV